MSQTSYSSVPAIGRKGMLADASPRVVESFFAEGDMTFGLLVQRGTDADEQVKPIAALPVSDVDSIIATPVATAAAPQTISGAQCDGVFGAGLIVPPQRITVALSNHADFDATTGIIAFEKPDGTLHLENLAIPDNGNVTLTTVNLARRFLWLYVPAQSGAGGAITAGTSVTYYAVDRETYPGVLCYDPLTASHAAATEVEDEQQVAVITQGRVLVEVEAEVNPGDAAWVRMVEAGADLRGQFRGSYAANFALLANAHFISSADADGLAWLELR